MKMWRISARQLTIRVKRGLTDICSEEDNWKSIDMTCTHWSNVHCYGYVTHWYWQLTLFWYHSSIFVLLFPFRAFSFNRCLVTFWLIEVCEPWDQEHASDNGLAAILPWFVEQCYVNHVPGKRYLIFKGDNGVIVNSEQRTCRMSGDDMDDTTLQPWQVRCVLTDTRSNTEPWNWQRSSHGCTFSLPRSSSLLWVLTSMHSTSWT